MYFNILNKYSNNLKEEVRVVIHPEDIRVEVLVKKEGNPK